MKYSKVEGRNDLIRDNETNAIINVNHSEYNKYLKIKSLKNSESAELSSLRSELSDLKNDIDEIKSLLQNILLNR
jgi:hypothetical protein